MFVLEYVLCLHDILARELTVELQWNVQQEVTLLTTSLFGQLLLLQFLNFNQGHFLTLSLLQHSKLFVTNIYPVCFIQFTQALCEVLIPATLQSLPEK